MEQEVGGSSPPNCTKNPAKSIVCKLACIVFRRAELLRRQGVGRGWAFIRCQSVIVQYGERSRASAKGSKRAAATENHAHEFRALTRGEFGGQPGCTVPRRLRQRYAGQGLANPVS